MEAASQTKIPSSLPIIAVLVMIGGALYVSWHPLESSRPEAPAGLRHLMEEEDKIDARLWQDPIKVVLDHEKAMHEEKGEGSDSYPKCASMHDVNTVSEQIGRFLQYKRGIPIVQVLLVMVRSGIYAEDHERRLRNRYAILFALHSSGFVPEDPEHMRYFRLPWAGEDELTKNIDEQRIPKIDTVFNKSLRSLVVPFEWFNRTEQYPPEHILVVWLAEDAFSHRPLTRPAQVIDALGHTQNNNVRIDMIGPSYSDTLQAMISEIKNINKNKDQPVDSDFVDVNSVLDGLTIFSPWSTTSPALLMPDEGWQDDNTKQNSISKSKMYEVIPDEFKKIGKKGIKFVRMIGSDDLLAMELINELRRRGVNVFPKDRGGKGHHIALISEWDRLYGRVFPLMFATMMESIDPNTGQPHDWNEYATILNLRMPSCDYLPDNLHTYSYIRGIDGKLPEGESREEKQRDEETESNSKRLYMKSPELSTGRSQIDYIRRLAQKLEEEYKVKAFGVVGTDVYDKLLLFQALREQLGDVILFTIDLDARMMHHEQFKWTRNVIVASNYGLELNEYYQRAVYQKEKGALPPFRDNYQTALFFACRTALGLSANANDNKLFREMEPEELTEFISHPRLFEIGRDRAVDLSVEHVNIHPRRPSLQLKPFLYKLGLILLAIVFCILLLVNTSTNIRRKMMPRTNLPEIMPTIGLEKAKKIDIVVILSALAIALFIFFVIFDHYRAKGEPFSLVAGVSIWFGEALRLLAAILSACFVIKSVSVLKSNEDALHKNFKLGPLDEFKKTRPQTSFAKWRGIKKRTEYFKLRCWRCFLRWISVYDWEIKEESIDARELWKDYRVRATTGNRFHRLIRMSLVYVGLAAMLMLIFGPPKTPYRGIVSLCVDRVLLFFSVISMIILIFFVVDATVLSLKFIRNLKTPTTIWPTELVKRFKDEESTAAEGIVEWLDIKFIASHTEAVGKLIYYPFIILLIMFVARNRYFDSWNWPISLIIIYLMNSIYALYCALMLRREAEETRQVALDRLGKELVEATAACDKYRTKHLETMIDEIKSLRQGAYSPFTQNPVLHAILIPSGGISLLTLLRFLPLS